MKETNKFKIRKYIRKRLNEILESSDKIVKDSINIVVKDIVDKSLNLKK